MTDIPTDSMMLYTFDGTKVISGSETKPRQVKRPWEEEEEEEGKEYM